MRARSSVILSVSPSRPDPEPPPPQVILFGSRARHEVVPDSSDWDCLILVDGPVDDARKDRIRHHLYEIEWDTGEVLSAIIYSQQEWDGARHQVLPLHNSVEKEGVIL
jgi:nucleotidyltransferase-like protein